MSRFSAKLYCLLAFFSLAFFLSGCEEPIDNQGDGDFGDTDSDSGDSDDSDIDIDGDGDDEPISCTPGEVVDCAGVEQSGLLICNSAGNGVQPAECPGTSVCRDSQCVQVACRPGSGRCIDNKSPQQCVSDGADDYEFVDQSSCGADETCESGVCLDRCGIAALTDTYMGCEYWAVETDNELLYRSGTGNETVAPQHRPPFAVVLANTETDVTSFVTVRGPDGEIATAVGSREVRSHRINPGEEWVTVHSETVNANGNRIAGPHNGPINGIELPPNSMLTLILPNQDIPFGSTTVTATAYKIETTQPVVAYQFNPLCCNYNYTNDASLLMPASSLTENYMMMSHAVWAGGSTNRLPDPRSATLTVVAMEDNTRVEVQLRGPASEGRTYADKLYPIAHPDRISGPDQNGLMVVTLNAHEVLNVAAGGTSPVVDITGTRVRASKPVAAFGAHTCTNVPFTQGACDHLESQLFPMETWGTNYIASPLKIRNPNPPSGSREGTYWKFLARENGTTIDTGISIAPGDVLPPSGEGVARCSNFSTNPSSGRFVLDAGQSCEFGTRKIFAVQSSRPISVGAFISGQNTVFDQVNWGDHAGDPSFFLLPPQQQYRTSYTFLTPATYFQSYITITTMPGFTLELDGEVIDPLDHPHEMLPDESMLLAHIEVDPGPHFIRSNVPFGLVVYGYDNYVSYAYTGGLNLTKLNPLDE